MSIKDEISYVKEELTSDEKILESAFRLERIYKKHKIKIWAVLILILIGIGSNTGYGLYKEHRLNEANIALLKLEKNPSDTTALNSLKENNPKLYSLYIYSKAVDQGKVADLKSIEALANPLGDLVRYHEAVLANRAGDSKYYYDLSLVEKAYEALKAGKKDIARSKLALVSENSPVANVARLLRHATIK